MEKTITLDHPVVFGGTEYKELTVRTSTVGDEEDALQLAINVKKGTNPITIEMCLFSILAGVPYDAMRQMQAKDYAKLRMAIIEVNGGKADSDPTRILTLLNG